MYYVYILQSKRDKQLYTGYSNNLSERLTYHQRGKVESTKNRLPLKLIYYEVCLDQKDAAHREKYLKTAWGKRYIKARLKNYLTEHTPLDSALGQNDMVREHRVFDVELNKLSKII